MDLRLARRGGEWRMGIYRYLVLIMIYNPEEKRTYYVCVNVFLKCVDVSWGLTWKSKKVKKQICNNGEMLRIRILTMYDRFFTYKYIYMVWMSHRLMCWAALTEL